MLTADEPVRFDPDDAARRAVLGDLRRIVGRSNLLTKAAATARYRSGYRHGGGAALAVVRPANLREFWRVA